MSPDTRTLRREVPQAALVSAYHAAREPMVSMLGVSALVELVVQSGVPQHIFLGSLGWTKERLQLTNASVPLSEVLRICDLAIDATGDATLGLRWAERLNQSTFAPISHMLSHVQTLRHGFELMSTFERLFCDQSVFTLLENEETALVRMRDWPRSSARAHRFAAEIMMGGLTKMFAAVCPGAKILRASFEYAPPRYATEYDRVFDAEVRFEQPLTAIHFESAWLSVPLPHVDRDVFRALEAVAERRLQSITAHAPYTTSLRELILRDVPSRVSMQAAARTLGVSERSLRRLLEAEGTSFREVESAALGSVSKWMLGKRRCSIQEAAYELGFADTATFHRAFKRWTGMTPSEFRSTAQ